MADLLNIGVNGLLAYQRSLATVSHNIANVNTDGYRRQSTELTTQVPQFSSPGFVGAGVKIQGVSRAYDQFVEAQVTSSAALFKQQETLHSLASNLDNLLADSDVGLSPTLQTFFKSLQDLSTDPGSTPVRQVLLSEGKGLTSVFNDTYSRLQGLKSNVNAEVSSAVNEINSLARSIADLNKDILTSRSGDPNFPANDLLDQRNNLINKLAEKVGVSTTVQDDGSINVFIGKGQSLVVGTTSQQLTTTPNAFDITQLEVGIAVGGSAVNITDQLTGGSLGGALTFRKDILDKAYQQLGRVALAISEDMNSQHQLGYDLNNQLGGNFFTDLTATSSLSNRSNATSTNHIYSATVSDSNLLQASNYRLDYGAGNVYSLTRLSDNAVVGSSASLATLSSTVSASEGFTLALGSGSSITTGDSFLISPVANAARDIDMALTHTNQIAAAAPLLASRNAANTGDAIFSNDGLLSNTGTLPAATITFTFNSATNEFVASPAAATTPPSAVLSYDPATNNGSQYQVTLAGVGVYQFNISGNPANGDQMDINVNNNASGDNRNILSMIGLQEQKLVGNGSTNYQEAYSELVAEVGVKTKRAEFSMGANQVLYERSVSSQLEVSGVNLDEEAADLIRFQQAYQAVARVISTADELFQSLLGAVSR